ncbi:hypothetical protein SteCoe_31875 [Stentor coeruleus]|uniref:GAIN-B domain-containing protein n=1 Tax=Stentor coeruleus TaxID=5963 RepID=A0A1R2B0B8_9CILI|nr:hypothetical protein SteCoe_31875 [Stentor coeruleus]
MLLLFIILLLSNAIDGYYRKVQENSSCNPICKTCSDYNFCLSCSDTNLYVDLSIGTCNSTCNSSTYILEKSCVSTCPISYYAIESPKSCIACPSGCLECSSSSICKNCSKGYLKLGTTCVLACPENNYYANYTGMYCGLCDLSCVQCNGDSLADCTLCAGGKVVYINDTGIGMCLDSCPKGTFLSGTICKNCIENCESCSDSEACLKCYTGYYLQGTKACDTFCDYGDIVDTETSSCISYTNIYPYGSISMSSFTLIKITYEVAVEKAPGSFNVYTIDNGLYTQVLTYNTSYETTISLETTIATLISTSSYTYDTYYTIEVISGSVASSFGVNIEIPKGIWTFYIKSYTYEPLVVIINSNIKGTEVKINSELTLDGSKSYDPSSGYIKSELFSVWNCEDFTLSYEEYKKNLSVSWADYISIVSVNDTKKVLCTNWDYIDPPDNSTIIINNFTAVNQVLRFIYTLSDNNNRTTTNDIFVLVVAEDANPISLQNIPIYKVNIDKEFQLFISNPIISNNVQYKWSVISSGLYPEFTTPLSSWVLAIASDSMSKDTEYIFSLTYSDSIWKSSAVVTIVTNSPPDLGTIYINPTSGTALIDTFISRMIGWVDIDLPLTYSFAISYNTSSVSYMISGLQDFNEITTVFPGGFVFLTGFCYDSLGARSQESIMIEVDFLHDLDRIDEEFADLPSVVDESNIFYIMPIIGCMANELNWTYDDISEVLEKKTSILELLIQSKSIADTMYIENSDVNSLYLYLEIVGVIETLIKAPVNDDLMTSAISLLKSIDFSHLEIKPIIYPIYNSTLSATSPQYIFHSDIIINLSYTLINIIDYISSYTNTSLLLGEIPELIVISKQVLALGSVITEAERTLISDNISIITTKSLLSSLENLNLTISSGVSVQVPQNLSTSISSTQVSIIIAYVKTNPFAKNLPILDSYILIELQDLTNGTLLIVSDLDSPFLISFNITRSILESMSSQVFISQQSTSKLNVQCAYWDSSINSWATNGCILSNLPDIYNYFQYENVPESFTIICSCYHLSQFSISFISSTIGNVSYIINEESTIVFKSNQWETTLVLYLMVCGFICMSLAMGFAYYWDKYNPGIRLPSVETEKTYRYWDPNKVDAVLGQLEKEFIRQKTDSSKSDKKDTNAAINKFLTSGLVSKLMLENTKDNREIYDDSLRAGRLHPIEAIMDVDSDDETTQSRTKKHLKKPMDDPRYLTSLVSEPKPRQHQSRRDLEGTIAQLKLHLSHLESNTQVKSPVDLFLEKYDESTKLTSILKSKLKVDHRELKRSDLKALGINPSEFTALRATKSGKIVSDCSMLTGGKYSQKILEEVRRFYGSLKMSYWSLFLMYIKKEHKYISLAFNLHIEYSKKQMLTLFSVYWYLQLLLCQIYITYFNWDKVYDESNKCKFGCSYEGEIFAGIICAISPWPVYYICKYLFARNMVEYAAPYATKTQAYQNKICREFVGAILSFVSISVCIVGICAVSIRDPFDTEKGKEFLYCYMASLIWSFFIGEFFATLIKAWLVWKASSENFKKEEGSEPSCLAKFAKGMLTLFPCLLPTEL